MCRKPILRFALEAQMGDAFGTDGLQRCGVCGVLLRCSDATVGSRRANAIVCTAVPVSISNSQN